MKNICLGIEFESVCIKAGTVGSSFKPISFGDYTLVSSGGAHHTV